MIIIVICSCLFNKVWKEHWARSEETQVVFTWVLPVSWTLGELVAWGSTLYLWGSLWCTEVSVYIAVQLLSCVWLFTTPWTAARQASLFITNSQSLLKLMSIESVMPSSHLTLCHHLLLLPSIFPSIRVFSNESALPIRWPNYWSFSFKSVLSMNTQDWSPLGWTGWISLQSKGLPRVFSNTTVQKHQFFGAQLSL